MKTRDLTLRKIFAIYEELIKDKHVILYKLDLNIYKQLRIMDYSEDIKTIYSSKLYNPKYFDKQITKWLKSQIKMESTK